MIMMMTIRVINKILTRAKRNYLIKFIKLKYLVDKFSFSQWDLKFDLKKFNLKISLT